MADKNYLEQLGAARRVAGLDRIEIGQAQVKHGETALVPENESQKQLLEVIRGIEDTIRQATRKLNENARAVALARLKFRGEDGLMLPNVNSCITGMEWLEELGKLNNQVIELVKRGAKIPSRYLATEKLSKSLADHDLTVSKEQRGVDLHGQK